MADEKDVCYLAGTQISKNSARSVADLAGNPIDLSGQTLITHVKRRRTDPTSEAIIIFQTSDNTLTISGALNDVITWVGVHQIDQDIYYYDTWWVEEEDYLERGKFIVKGNVTRI